MVAQYLYYMQNLLHEFYSIYVASAVIFFKKN